MTSKTCIACRQPFYASHDWKTMCIPCFVASKKGAAPANHLELENARLKAQIVELSCALPDAEMMRRIRMLCHPDKHDGSVSSVTATQWLNVFYGKDARHG